MGTILRFESPPAAIPARPRPDADRVCEIVIFPGVRIERHQTDDLDLSHRLRDSAGRGAFDGIGGGRPRKTS
jgi:hypothetical protein